MCAFKVTTHSVVTVETAALTYRTWNSSTRTAKEPPSRRFFSTAPLTVLSTLHQWCHVPSTYPLRRRGNPGGNLPISCGTSSVSTGAYIPRPLQWATVLGIWLQAPLVLASQPNELTYYHILKNPWYKPLRGGATPSGWFPNKPYFRTCFF